MGLVEKERTYKLHINHFATTITVDSSCRLQTSWSEVRVFEVRGDLYCTVCVVVRNQVRILRGKRM